MDEEPVNPGIDLFWLPLGAGGHVVRVNGRLYERWMSCREHRVPADLYHCALMLYVDDTTYAVEMGPVWNLTDADRGVVVEGPVGARWLGRFRAFRYEMRCWPGGYLPDVTAAVDSPRRITEDPTRVAAVLHVLRELPDLTWGRDELGAGEMWNSNSAVAWALARTGHDMDAIVPPPGGRAPGWNAGLVLADRQGRGLVTMSRFRPPKPHRIGVWMTALQSGWVEAGPGGTAHTRTTVPTSRWVSRGAAAVAPAAVPDSTRRTVRDPRRRSGRAARTPLAYWVVA